MTDDPRRHQMRDALDGLWLTETATGYAVALDDMLARLDKAGLTTPRGAPTSDNDLEYSDNFKLHTVSDGEVRLVCVCCAGIVFSNIDCVTGWPVSLASLIEAAEEHEGGHCVRA